MQRSWLQPSLSIRRIWRNQEEKEELISGGGLCPHSMSVLVRPVCVLWVYRSFDTCLSKGEKYNGDIYFIFFPLPSLFHSLCKQRGVPPMSCQ